MIVELLKTLASTIPLAFVGYFICHFGAVYATPKKAAGDTTVRNTIGTAMVVIGLVCLFAAVALNWQAGVALYGAIWHLFALLIPLGIWLALSVLLSPKPVRQISRKSGLRLEAKLVSEPESTGIGRFLDITT